MATHDIFHIMAHMNHLFITSPIHSNATNHDSMTFSILTLYFNTFRFKICSHRHQHWFGQIKQGESGSNVYTCSFPANFVLKYRSGTVNSKSFVSKDFLQIKWKYELTVHFKHEMIGKHFTETSNQLEFRIDRVRINRARPTCS